MPLKIYVDFALPPEALTRLKEGAAEHYLLFPSKPATSVLTKTETDPLFFEADVVFGQPELDAIEKADRLKWIHINTSGITRYDTSEFRASMSQRGIPVSNSANVYNEACADHLLAFMLAQSRILPQAIGFSAPNGSDNWFQLRRGSVSLRGQSAIILGFGAIGSRLVELLAPYEMDIQAFRRNPRGDESIPIVDAEQLPTALARAEHILNILPDSESTRDFFDAARFAQCKPGAVFYNIGRGATVDQTALAAALADGTLKEAWLDVTEPEPLPGEHPLRQLPNCYITPHIAGGHQGEATTCVNHFLDNLGRYQNQQQLVNRVI